MTPAAMPALQPATEGLSRRAGGDAREQIAEAARQFEALFLSQMLRAMRSAGVQSELTESRQVRMYQEMLDNELSTQMAKRGVGLADALTRQLAGAPARQPMVLDASLAVALPRAPQAASAPERLAAARPAAMAGNPQAGPRAPRGISQGISQGLAKMGQVADRPQEAAGGGNVFTRFVERFSHAARSAADATGVPALLILAQAALETGWGQHMISTGDGGNSHNLFGIKATAGWRGASTDSATHEYVAGRRVAAREAFRVYDDYAQSFADHARLIGTSPRYAPVREASTPQDAARALQECGYATDPAYADKLVSIMRRIDGVATL